MWFPPWNRQEVVVQGGPLRCWGFWQCSCFRKSKNVGPSKFGDGGSILKLTIIRLRLKMSEVWDVFAIWLTLLRCEQIWCSWILPLAMQPQLFRQLEFRLIVALISRHQHLSLKLSSATRSNFFWNILKCFKVQRCLSGLWRSDKDTVAHHKLLALCFWLFYQHQPGTICVVWDHILAVLLGTGNVRTSSSPSFSLAHGCST